MLTVCRPGAPTVTVRGWLFGSATKAMRFAALLVVEMFVKSRPGLPYWFESPPKGVRRVKNPNPPRACDRRDPPLLRSQLNPARGDHISGAGTTSVAYPKSA